MQQKLLNAILQTWNIARYKNLVNNVEVYQAAVDTDVHASTDDRYTLYTTVTVL